MGGGAIAPVEEGEQFTVEIEDLDDDGDGVVRVEGFTLYVPEGEVGERVTVRIDTVHDEFASASVIEDEWD